jgi:hypothetical protein
LSRRQRLGQELDDQPHQVIDGQREDSEHQVTVYLGVAAHPYIARTEIILEAAINAFS